LLDLSCACKTEPQSSRNSTLTNVSGFRIILSGFNIPSFRL
jgi:hypothetical protein